MTSTIITPAGVTASAKVETIDNAYVEPDE